jgi:hypothetical protein
MPPRPSFLSPAALDDDLHALLDRFEAAWQGRAGGPPPRWQDFLPPPGLPCPCAFVFELLALDVHYRLAARLPALLAEPYAADERLLQAGVAVTAEMRVELIGLEYQGRWQRGERPTRQVYLDRRGRPSVGVAGRRAPRGRPERSDQISVDRCYYGCAGRDAIGGCCRRARLWGAE